MSTLDRLQAARGLSSPEARTQAEPCGMITSSSQAKRLTTVILKLRLQATLKFRNFQTRLSALATASKNENYKHLLSMLTAWRRR